MRRIHVRTNAGGYPVVIGRGLLDNLSGRLARLPGCKGRKLFTITSPEIWSLWGRRFLRSFGSPAPVVLFLPDGERSKSIFEIERLSEELAEAGADRSALLLAFGGGVVGDAAGFLASIYMRGIDYIQVPTTLLAQVDSSVGGKTGVNLKAGKNLIGAFHPPRAVFASIDTLGTLPLRELRAGLHESLKAALIRAPSLFRFIEANRMRIERLDPAAIEKVIAASVRMKAAIAGRDERESGERMILNFGHTIGHAIETASGYGTMLHGEAIAWGMLVALEVGRGRGWLSARETERAEAAIRSFDPPRPPAIEPRSLIEAASRDKKNRGERRSFVLLQGLGRAIVTEDVSDGELVNAIETVLPFSQSRKAPKSAKTKRGASK